MSSVRKIIKAYKYLDAQALTASFSAPWLHTDSIDNISLMLSVTCAANNGQFYIDVSNDPTEVAGIPAPVVYDTVLFSGIALPALASANVIMTPVTQLNSFYLVRIRFVIGATHTDGTVTAYVHGKGA